MNQGGRCDCEMETIMEDDIERRTCNLESLIEPLFDKKIQMIQRYGRELSPETLKKERNKEYSRINRRKKKEYVKILENKVNELENKVQQLTEQLKIEKSKVFALRTGYERDYEDMKETQAYFDTEFLDYLETCQDCEKGREKMKQLCELHGPGGEDRQKMIKQRFKSIIDNIMPPQTQCFLHLFSESSAATDYQYERLFRLSKLSA